MRVTYATTLSDRRGQADTPAIWLEFVRLDIEGLARAVGGRRALLRLVKRAVQDALPVPPRSPRKA